MVPGCSSGQQAADVACQGQQRAGRNLRRLQVHCCRAFEVRRSAPDQPARPSGKATAMNRGPRAHASDRTARRCRAGDGKGPWTVTVEISPIRRVADRGCSARR
jgi:hypothetical protein